MITYIERIEVYIYIYAKFDIAVLSGNRSQTWLVHNPKKSTGRLREETIKVHRGTFKKVK